MKVSPRGQSPAPAAPGSIMKDGNGSASSRRREGPERMDASESRRDDLEDLRSAAPCAWAPRSCRRNDGRRQGAVIGGTSRFLYDKIGKALREAGRRSRWSGARLRH
jgi:hypothetical protein